MSASLPVDTGPNGVRHAFARYQAGDVEAALAFCRAILQARPDDPRALLLSGIIALQRGDLAQALDLVWRSIVAYPDEPTAYKRLAQALCASGRPDEAWQALRAAVDRVPYRADAWSNLAAFLYENGRQDEVVALEKERSALQRRWDLVNAKVQRGFDLLREGRFEEGWKGFEARLERADFLDVVHQRIPRWRGEALAGKSILLRGEQGHGDQLQFFRYAQTLIDRGARVGIETLPLLVRLLAGNTGAVVVDRLSPHDTSDYDYYCPLMSLPFQLGTRLHSIPNAVPYLAAEPALAQRWRARFEGLEGMRVGLVWAGGEQPLDPLCADADSRRSFAFSQYEPLLGIPGVIFVNLQKDRVGEQAQAAIAAGSLRDWTGELADFADTAALVDNLDLVITVDTAVAHLAGAMNKPTWILSRHDGCWRWLEDRDDSPWYPAVRLFRQKRPGDWRPEIARVRDALARRVATFQH